MVNEEEKNRLDEIENEISNIRQLVNNGLTSMTFDKLDTLVTDIEWLIEKAKVTVNQE